MNEEWKAAVPATAEEVELARQRMGQGPLAQAAVPAKEGVRAAVPATPEEIEEAKIRNLGRMPGPDAATFVPEGVGKAAIPATPEEIEMARRRQGL